MKQRVLLSMALAAGLAATSVHAARDHFNQGTLGPQWQIDEGTMEVVGKRLYGSDRAIARNTNAAADNTAWVEVRINGTDVQYGAVVVGYRDWLDNAFLKVQSQYDQGTFDAVGFYFGDNGSGGSAGTFILTPELSAYSVVWIKGSLSGSVATLSVDVDLDGKADIVYSYDYGFSFGRGAGLGTYGAAALDFFMSRKGPAEPAKACAAPGCKLIKASQRATAHDATR